MNEWQPIETAITDGRKLLLGWWVDFPEKGWVQEVNPAGNTTLRQGMCWLHGYATHWMPLPEPPK